MREAIRTATLHHVVVTEIRPHGAVEYRVEVEYIRDGGVTGFAVTRSDKTAALLRCLERLSEVC